MSIPQWQTAFLARHELPADYLGYAQQWFAPLAERLAAHQNGAEGPLLVAVNGSQGSGKTTVCDYLRETLQREHGRRVLSLSLDDFYLTLRQRRKKAASIHPLLATRGVPGTHDMDLLRSTLEALLSPAGGTVRIPRFDKAIDDRRPAERWDVVTETLDLVLLEGWCLGVRHQDQAALQRPVNDLEGREDPQGLWRAHVNDVVQREFEPLYRRVGQWVMLCAPSFDCVYQWRLEQEHKLAQRSTVDTDSRIMDDAQVARFIQFYERLTRHCLQQLPQQVHHLYRLDTQRQVVSATHTEIAGL